MVLKIDVGPLRPCLGRCYCLRLCGCSAVVALRRRIGPCDVGDAGNVADVAEAAAMGDRQRDIDVDGSRHVAAAWWPLILMVDTDPCGNLRYNMGISKK